MSEPSNGSGSRTWARVNVLLELSSLSANLSKAQVSEGWSSDITTEVLGASSIVMTGLPSVSTRALPARAVSGLVRWHDNSRGSLNILLSAVKLKGKHQGRVGELVPRDSFDIIQGSANSGPGRLGIPEVWNISDRREAEGLSEQAEMILS